MARRLAALDELAVTVISGVGPRTAGALSDLGIETVLDLVTHYPRRYIDRTKMVTLRELRAGEEATVVAKVRRITSRRTRQGRALVEMDVFDGASYLHCSFFNQPWRVRQLPEGTEVVLFGRMELYRGQRRMVNPLVDKIAGDRTGRIVPVYPQTDQLTSDQLGAWIAEALRRAGELVDPLPPEVRRELGLMGRMEAFAAIHGPVTMEDRYRARHRLAFDELLRLQMILVMRKRALERDALGIRHVVDGPLVSGFLQRLPFPLTEAQRRSTAEIAQDMAAGHPMHRLLQGDVGSGKTLVAVVTMLTAVDGGHQAALMAPTEVLAEQHHLGISALVEHLVIEDAGTLFQQRPVRVELLTSRVGAGERARILAGLRERTVDAVVGTHALLTEGVDFADLGAVVIDEQHRFGVEQRSALRDKGAGVVPDVLVMTATPIPRTAAMTVYGDLDTTILDELPPGRTPITTQWSSGPLHEQAAWAQVKAEVAAGHQAYVVCPLVDGSERVQARSATEELEALRSGALEGLRLGLLHGQLPAREKEQVMAAFRSGELDVLVATTVIEVGVDVPNATVMVIEDAERFGIAQLHQLRGRVGRGAAQSWCFLLGEGATPEGKARMEALVRTTDGFELAEVDLELRGEGTVLGTRQKGASDLKLASLRRDLTLVEDARRVAFTIVDGDPHLDGHPDLAEELAVLVDEEERGYLFKS